MLRPESARDPLYSSRSSVLSPVKCKLSRKFLVHQQLEAHYKKLNRAKASVDNKCPDTYMKSVLVQDRFNKQIQFNEKRKVYPVISRTTQIQRPISSFENSIADEEINADIIEKHKKNFTEEKPFTPRILKKKSVSKISLDPNIYNPPKRTIKEKTNTLELERGNKNRHDSQNKELCSRETDHLELALYQNRSLKNTKDTSSTRDAEIGLISESEKSIFKTYKEDPYQMNTYKTYKEDFSQSSTHKTYKEDPYQSSTDKIYKEDPYQVNTYKTYEEDSSQASTHKTYKEDPYQTYKEDPYQTYKENPYQTYKSGQYETGNIREEFHINSAIETQSAVPTKMNISLRSQEDENNLSATEYTNESMITENKIVTKVDKINANSNELMNDNFNRNVHFASDHEEHSFNNSDITSISDMNSTFDMNMENLKLDFQKTLENMKD